MTQDQKDQVAKLAPTHTMKQLSDKVGATYKAVHAHCRKFGITPKNRSHAKQPSKKAGVEYFDVCLYDNWIVGQLKYFPKTA